jgi:anti-sigma-K factor RskA
MSERRDPDLASYVLGELGQDERREFDRLLAANPELAAEAEQLRLLVGRLDEVDSAAWEPPVPPPLRLDAAALETPAEAASPRPRQKREPLLGRLFGRSLQLRPALAATLAVLLFGGGIAAGLTLSGGSDDEPAQIVASRSATLQPIGSLEPAASGEAQVDSSGAKMRIRVSGLSPSGEGDFYEAWMMNAEQGLVSLGSFTVGEDGSAQIDVPVPVDAEAFPIVDISLEPADGAPAHSGKSVLRAELI